MLSTKMPKLLLVGSGLTSAVTAALLKLETANDTPVDLSIWDKSRGTGGRMSTSRSPLDNQCTVDLGAQYISSTPHYENLHRKYYEELLAGGVLEPLTESVVNVHKYEEGTKHFVAGDGIGSLVKYYVSKSSCKPSFDHHVSEISRQDGKWLVSTLKGHQELFDGVILTMPVEQLFLLKGSVPGILDEKPDVVQKLKSVEYSSRYALGLFYESGTDLKLPYTASYLTDDPVFRFIAVDNVKRNQRDLPPSVVLHTCVPFGLEHIDKTTDQVQPLLMAALAHSFPNLPTPKAIKCHKWRYSQVSKAYQGQPGMVELSRHPLLVIGGDAFTHSNFDGCVSSAEAVANAVLNNLGHSHL